MAFAFFTIVSCDNEIKSAEVPSIVLNTFKSQFPNAMDIEWEIINDDYEVSFELKNIDHDALLDRSGNLLKYKYEIDETALPGSIKFLLKQQFPQEKWEDFEHIIVGTSNFFQMEVDGFFTDKKLVVDSLGKMMPNIKYWN